MRVLLLTQYFKPETVGAAIWIHELALDLAARGHEVMVLTAFPNYPAGVVFKEYRGRFWQDETIDGVEVSRTWIYSTNSKSFWKRAFQFGSFCLGSLALGLFRRFRPDVIYAILPPLPLGVSAVLLGAAKRARVVLNIQDIYPRAAVALGVLKNKRAIHFFEAMERWIYHRADRIVVISDGFHEDLLAKGVPAGRLFVVKNWADPSFIRPGGKDNSFRHVLNPNGRFLVIYSGGLTHNSQLEPLLLAAVELQSDPFLFVIVGDGVRKEKLQHFVAERRLQNVVFKPFQPLDRYPEVLLSADLTLVTLSPNAGSVSVPSKIFKQMAAGRPILAITPDSSELERLVRDARCGITVAPGDISTLVQNLRWARNHPEELDEMGRNARSYLEENHSRARCTEDIAKVLTITLKS
jgi:colanic acid biosynthesis glycosyl transferase WcaI